MNMNKQISFQFNWYMHAQSLNHIWLFVTPMDCGPPESFVHGILQARALEWGAIAFSRYMYTYGWFMFSFDREQQTYLKQLSFI